MSTTKENHIILYLSFQHPMDVYNDPKTQ